MRWKAVFAAVIINVTVVNGATGRAALALIVGVSKYDKVPGLTEPGQGRQAGAGDPAEAGLPGERLTDPNRAQLIEGLGEFEEAAKGSRPR